MPRKTHTDRPDKRSATNPTEVLGAPIHGLPTSALLFWLHHFTAGTPTRKALLDEIEARDVAL